MSKLTYSEFCKMETGVQISEGEFDTLLFFAQAAVNSYTLPEYWECDGVKNAVALQITLSKQQGGTAYYSEMSSGSRVTGEKLGDYSYSVSVTNNAAQLNNGLFPIVAQMLKPFRVKAVNVLL